MKTIEEYEQIINKLASNVIECLIKNEQQIATMESCTGGLLASEITNISGSSEVLKTSLVTYSNKYKVKFGVNQNTIDTYTVYSKEVAAEMSKQAAIFADSFWGIGITGQIGRIDPCNPGKNDNEIYYSIYCKQIDDVFVQKIELDNEIAKSNNRLIKKYVIVETILESMEKILKGE